MDSPRRESAVARDVRHEKDLSDVLRWVWTRRTKGKAFVSAPRSEKGEGKASTDSPIERLSMSLSLMSLIAGTDSLGAPPPKSALVVVRVADMRVDLAHLAFLARLPVLSPTFRNIVADMVPRSLLLSPTKKLRRSDPVSERLSATTA